MLKRLIVSLVVAAAVLPSTALAGTATYSGGAFGFTANPGEQNYMYLKTTTDCDGLPSPCFEVTDDPFYEMEPPPDCVKASFTPGIRCPMPSSVTVDLGDGVDHLFDWDGPSSIDGGPGTDIIRGRGGDDQLFGDTGDDQLVGGPGDDGLTGALGDDTLEALLLDDDNVPENTEGKDSLAGAEGTDTVSYEGRTDPIDVAIDGAANDGGAGENDIVGTDIEIVKGGQVNDTLVGNENPNGLFGRGGDDSIYADAGDDDVDGGPGADAVIGAEGADKVAGGSGDDKIEGGPGRDTLSGENLGGCKITEYCVGGADQIFARDGEPDSLSCGPGDDFAEVDQFDSAFLYQDCDRIDGQAGATSGTSAAAACRKSAPRASRGICVRLARGLGKCGTPPKARCVKRHLSRARRSCKRLRRKHRKACTRFVKQVSKLPALRGSASRDS